jgi:hypothetical protein
MILLNIVVTTIIVKCWCFTVLLLIAPPSLRGQRRIFVIHECRLVEAEVSQAPSLAIPVDLIHLGVTLTAPLRAAVGFSVQVPLIVVSAAVGLCAGDFDHGGHFICRLWKDRLWSNDVVSFNLLTDNTNFFAATTVAPLSIGLHDSSLLKVALPAVHFTVGRVIEVPLRAVIPRPIANLVSKGSKPGLVTALILHHLVDVIIILLTMDARD